jgi:peptide/nickel transport system substrate-binding protein
MKSAARWILVLLPLAFPSAGPACRGPAVPSTIRIGHRTDVLSLDPILVGDTTTYSVLSNIYEGLVDFDRDMRLVPALATSWSAVDEHTWLVELRRGVRFHDGALLTAFDAKAALDRAQRDPASAVSAKLATLEEIEVVGEHTLRLKTRGRDALLLNRLAFVRIGRVSRSVGAPDRPLGTGPYRFLGRTRGGAVELAAFEGYRESKPAIDHVFFIPVEKERELALKQGRVDVVEFVAEPMPDGNGLTPLQGIRVAAREGLGTTHLWINSEQREGEPRNPFADRRVRHAVSGAIDRRELARRLAGLAVPAHQLVQKGIFGYIASLPELAFDPEGSSRLLAEAGYGDGFETSLTFPRRPAAASDPIAEAVRGMLAKIGIRAALRAIEWPSMVTEWNQGRLPFFLATWTSDDGDASSFLKDCLFTRDPARQKGESNPGFSSPKLDRLIAENAGILEQRDRLKHYGRVMGLAMEEMPLVPLYHRLNVYGVSQRVRWEPRLDGRILVAEMSLRAP